MTRRAGILVAVGGALAVMAGIGWRFRSSSTRRPSPAARVKPSLTASVSQLPLSFELNQGQFDSRVLYAARGPGETLFFTREGLTLALPQLGPAPAPSTDPASRFMHRRKVEKVVALTMAFDGANPTPVVEASEHQAGIKNYLIGRDPAQWHTHVPLFGKVAYRGLYPGVDLVFRGANGQLEYDLEVAPDADLRQIRFRFEGADRVEQVDRDVVVHAGPFELRQPRLHVYDTSSAGRRELAAGYRVDDGRWIGFDVPGRPARHGLLIDPVLAYSTYLTGNGGNSGDGLAEITFDAAGNVYVGGSVDSTNFPTTDGGYERANPDPTNAYGVATVTKLDPTLSALVFSTYLGGMHEADGGQGGVATGLVVTDAGLVYVSGATDSVDFPAGPPQATYGGGGLDCFAAELSADGSELFFATLLGGPATDQCMGLDLDPSGNIDLVGITYLPAGQSSPGLPVTTPAIQGTYGGSPGANCFFARVNPSRGSFDFVSYFGGSGTGVYPDSCVAIKADADAAFWILGYTGSGDLPRAAMSPRPFHADGGGGDGFVARIASDGGGVLDFAYLGGSGVDYPWEMALDPGGNVYVTGQTSSADFPVSAGALQTSNASGQNLNALGPFDAFVTELSPEGAILYSTYLGGEGDDRGFGVALDSARHIHLSGITTSVGLERDVKDPLHGEHDQSLGFDVAPSDGGAFFLADLTLDGGLDFFTYFGVYGPPGALPLPYGNTLAIDAADNLYFAGTVFQDGFPVTSGAFQAHDQAPVGLGTLVVSKIIPTPPPATLTAIQPSSGRSGTNVDVFGTNLGPQCQLTFGGVVEPLTGTLGTTELQTQLLPTSDCGPVDVSVACLGSPIFVLPEGFTYIGCDGGGTASMDGGMDGGTDGGTAGGSSGCSCSAASAPEGILFALVMLAAASGSRRRQRRNP